MLNRASTLVIVKRKEGKVEVLTNSTMTKSASSLSCAEAVDLCDVSEPVMATFSPPSAGATPPLGFSCGWKVESVGDIGTLGQVFTVHWEGNK